MNEPPPEGWPAYWKARVAVELAEARATHARVCSGLGGALLKVAQHHYPVPGTKSLYCAGCELDFRDAVGDWPCPTWALIADTPPAPDPAEVLAVLGELVALKDGPRDEHYRASKDDAWDRARALVAESSGQVRQRD